MHQDKDRGGHWLFAHFGAALLKLVGEPAVASCTAVKGDLVAPRRYPDGVLEVTFPDRPGTGLYLIEIEAYAAADADRQMLEDLMLVTIDRRRLPEAIVLVLRPKGNARVTGRVELANPGGHTRVGGNWRVVELWTLNADDLLAQNDVGLIPWVPLARTTTPPDVLLRECRARIDRDAPPERRDALLVVTQIMASILYDETQMDNLFQGVEKIFDTPYVRRLLDRRVEEEVEKERAKIGQEVEKERARIEQEREQERARIEQERAQMLHAERVENILHILAARFGASPDDLRALLAGISDQVRLSELLQGAATCPDVEAFRARLAGG